MYRVEEQNPNGIIWTNDNLSLHDVKRALQGLVKVALPALLVRYLVHRRGGIDAKQNCVLAQRQKL